MSILITCLLLSVLILQHWFCYHGHCPSPNDLHCLSLSLTERGGVHCCPRGLHQWCWGDRSLQPAWHHYGSHRNSALPPLRKRRGVVRVVVTWTDRGTNSISRVVLVYAICWPCFFWIQLYIVLWSQLLPYDLKRNVYTLINLTFFFPNMNDKNCLVDYEIFQVCLW